jgi:peptidoglycan/LPS O-acetylase OafA/YrhL
MDTTATAPSPGTTGPAWGAGTAKSWGYRPALDGVRCVAVVVTIFFHAGVTRAAGGFIGLDLFFVLSGFLVSNVLLSELDERGEVRFGRFFARRVRRLLPAAVVTVLVTSVAFVLVASEPERLEMIRQARAALLYVANWQFIADGSDYFATDLEKSPFMHFWSLSVEEQFYVFLPVVLLLWLRFTARRGRVLLGWLLALTALSVVSQLVWAEVDPTRAYYATDARLFQLLTGVVLAVGLRELGRSRPDLGSHWPRVGSALAVAGLVGVVLLTTTAPGMAASHRNLLATLAAGALVLGVFTAPGALVSRGLSVPSVVYIGKVSYGTYLWHWPLLLVLGRVLDERPFVVAMIALGLSVSIAAASYQLLETPIRRTPRLDPFPWPVVAGGLVVSLVSAVAVVGPILTIERRPTLVAPAASGPLPQGGAWAERPVPAGLDFDALNKDRGPDDTYCRPSSPQDCLAVDGDGPHVVLVGDSQARMLTEAFEQLARDEGFKLSLSVATGCPWQDGLRNVRLSQESQDACTAARSDFYDQTLPQLDADLVVLVSLARSNDDWEGDVVSSSGSQQPLNELQRDAVDRTLQRIEAAGARAVMVKSILGTDGWDDDGFDPLDCLARAERQGECAVSPPLERPVADALYEAAAVGTESAATVDLNDIFCSDASICRPIVDGIVVWRDPRHVTSQVAVHFRREIWAEVRATGMLGG